MNRHAQAPSAFTHGKKAALALVLVAMSVLALAPAAFAGAIVETFFPAGTGTGALGGQFNNPRGIAISQSGAGAADPGDIYVVDATNHRVQRFSPTGTFERAWGVDVVDGVANPGAAGDTGTGAAAGFEICTNAAHCKQGLNGGGNASDNLRNGQLNLPQGIAINEVSGDVYVRDRGNNRVNQYTADGVFVRSWGWDVIHASSTGNVGTEFEVCPATEICKAGAGGAGNGQFGATTTDGTGIAIDTATGDVFVADPGVAANRRVMRFEADGDYIDKLGGQGPGLGLFGSSVSLVVQPNHLEVSDGVLYVSDCDTASNFHQVERYALSTATWLVPLNVFGASCSGTGSTNRGLASDPDTGNLFVARTAAQGVLEYDVSVDPPELIDTHVATAGLLANGIAFSDERLYLTSSSSGAHRLYIADGDGNTQAPEVTINPPAGIGAHTAKFSGTVNPGGFPSSYRFEYSKSGAEGTWKAVAPMAVLGDGTSPIDIPLNPSQGEVSDLEANSLYRVRVVANRGFGNADTPSPELTFFTHTVKPEVQTNAPQHLLDTSVQLVGKVNPNNLPTTYWFEYGAHLAYGSKAPVPSASLTGDGVPRRVVQQIAGIAPATTYNYRLCATNAQGTQCGNNTTFTTRAVSSSLPAGRAYEMVTPPFKATRSNTTSTPPPGYNVNSGFPAHDGNAYAWDNFVFPLTEDVGVPGDGDRRIVRRTSTGWVSRTLNSRRPVYEGEMTTFNSEVGADASSGDFGTMAYHSSLELISQEGGPSLQAYTRRDGTGLDGFTPWITNTDTQQAAFGLHNNQLRSLERAAFNDSGTAMVRWGRYRGLGEDPATPGDDDPSDEQQLPGVSMADPLAKPPLGGHSAYLQQAENPGDLPTAPKELINECTGTGAEATLIPARVGGGSPTDTISTQACEDHNVTSDRGAIVGHGLVVNTRTEGISAGALSDDGRRIFFESPDPVTSPPARNCTEAIGAATFCPPQLFVRQYDENGENPVVRWISRAQGIGEQQIGQMGTGVVYQGASSDGRYVFFTTNAPLTPDDPNGGNSITNGTASSGSYDLYRYELPEGLDSDPASGTLLRVSGGPSGSADASTGADSTHAALRFLSDDGTRAYFLTERPIDGADASAPYRGATVPSNSGRNLYLFDSSKTGDERYKFIANLPFDLSEYGRTCATAFSKPSRPLASATAFRLQITPYNCVRGTRDGSHITFSTFAQLTDDDDDSAGDIYLYDVLDDELVRVTAPGPSALPYGCTDQATQLGPDQPVKLCNGDQGFGFGGNGAHGTAAAGEMDAAGGWGGVGRYDGIAMDEDGVVSVFFESRSALVPEDINGSHWDVYEWREGKVSMISPGDSSDHSWFVGNSTDGRDVFIVTSKRLDPREIDPQDYDVYDARIGGGFVYTPPPTPCDVIALRCEGEAIASPQVRGAASTSLIGSGNAKSASTVAKSCPRTKVRRKGRCVNRRQNLPKSKQRTKKRKVSKNGRVGR